ncbi:MAG: hypothetical protein Q8M16_07090 [Pirellulaceae bacterium]|nr:hypothetical protein [Pirellulaceae bacterium]
MLLKCGSFENGGEQMGFSRIRRLTDRRFSNIARLRLRAICYFYLMICIVPTAIASSDSKSLFLQFITPHEQRFLASVANGEQEILIKRQGYTALYSVRVHGLDYAIEVHEILDANGNNMELTESQCLKWQVDGRIPSDSKLMRSGIRAGNAKYEFVLDKLDGEAIGFEIKTINLSDQPPRTLYGASPIHLPICVGARPLGAEIAGSYVELKDWRFDSARNIWVAKVVSEEYIQLIEIDPNSGLFLNKEVYEINNAKPVATHRFEYVDGRFSRWALYRNSIATPKEQRFYRHFEAKKIDPSSLLISHYGFDEPLPTKTNAWGNDVTVWIIITILGIFVLIFARQMQRK